MGRIPTQKEIDESVKLEISKEAKLWYKSNACSITRANTFAKEILKEENLYKLNNIETINREDYKVKHKETGKEESNRLEEQIALKLYKENHTFKFGKLIDYQIPLKKVCSDKGVGKIDLLAYNESKNIITLLELKKPDSSETLLRAVLEIYTYSKILNADNIKNSFKIPCDAIIEPAVLLFKGTKAYDEYKTEKVYPKQEESYTCKLMKKLDIKFYSLDYIVSEI